MTTFRAGDKIRRRPDAPRTGVDTPGAWTVTHVFGPVLRIRQGRRVNVVLGANYITERHARVIAAHAESVRRVGAERVARLARLWAAER
ncbi:hypothetical protein M1247_29565 [Mycobacterium sp. 21AC1]|uniref:hypothetical protein n=1 Tax=[Mycobacterium] appelbergii TaxID=2939269 RepID=UPI002938E3B2|nr:hypothetical protein [Mycobacterium sp. 21AC1]MDV3129086.1 hypothetical protein [Mycobacterium sp. 21AC1]